MIEQDEQPPEVVQVEDGWRATCQTCGKWSIVKDSELSAKRALAAHMGSCPGKASPSETMGEPGVPSSVEEEGLQYRRDLKELGQILHDFGVSDQLIGRIKRRVLEDPAFLGSTNKFEELLRGQGITNEHKVKTATEQIFKAIRPDVLRGFSEDDQERGRRPVYYDEGDSFLREEVKDLKAELKDVQEKLHKAEMGELKSQITALYGKVQELESRDPFDQMRKYDEWAESRGYSRTGTGKSLIDVGDKLTDKFDARASEVIDLLKKPGQQFSPEVTRTPQERREAAADIQRNLEKKEQILEAENELLAIVYKEREELEQQGIGGKRARASAA